jgi:hypothetical protein
VTKGFKEKYGQNQTALYQYLAENVKREELQRRG